MPTQTEMERLMREIIRESSPDLTLRSVKPIPNDQGDGLWDIDVKCLGCEVGGFSILVQDSAGNVPEQIRRKIQEHLARH